MQPQATINEGDQRIPKIIEMELEGHTTPQIAEALGTHRTTIWRDKQKPQYLDLYNYFVNNWIERYEEILNDMYENGTPQYKNEAAKEIGRMIRGTKTRQIETKSLHATVDLNDNKWIEHMTPTDFKEFQDMKAKALQRMNPNTKD